MWSGGAGAHGSWPTKEVRVCGELRMPRSACARSAPSPLIGRPMRCSQGRSVGAQARAAARAWPLASYATPAADAEPVAVDRRSAPVRRSQTFTQPPASADATSCLCMRRPTKLCYAGGSALRPAAVDEHPSLCSYVWLHRCEHEEIRLLQPILQADETPCAHAAPACDGFAAVSTIPSAGGAAAPLQG